MDSEALTPILSSTHRKKTCEHRTEQQTTSLPLSRFHLRFNYIKIVGKNLTWTSTIYKIKKDSSIYVVCHKIHLSTISLVTTQVGLSHARYFNSFMIYSKS